MNDQERYQFEEVQRARRAIFECPHCNEQKERIARVVRTNSSYKAIATPDGRMRQMPPPWQQIPAEDVMKAVEEFTYCKVGHPPREGWATRRTGSEVVEFLREWLYKRILEMW